MRTTTARRFLFGNWTDVVRRAMGKASPVASVESDAVKSPPDARESLPEAGETSLEATKPGVELPSDAVEALVYSVEETMAEKRVKGFSKRRSLAWEQAMGFLDQSSASKKEKRLDPLFILKHRCDLATGPQLFNHKNHVSEYENSFAQNDRFFRKLALTLYYSPHIPFQEMAPYTRSLQVDLWYHLRCAAYLQRARIRRLDLVSRYDLIKVLHNTLWHWRMQNQTFSMEILLIVKWGSDYIPRDLFRHFHDYQHTWAKLMADQKEMFQSFNNILLRRTRTSARQAVFNAHYHVHRIGFSHKEELRTMKSELDKEGRNSFRYVQIGHETRSSWKSMISKTIECATELHYLYRKQFIPILIRRLELMSPAELDRHTALARRYWMRYWQRQSESEEIEKRFKELSTMTRREIKEIRQAQNKAMQARRQERKEYREAQHVEPSLRLDPSARDQNSSKIREFDDIMLKSETVQLNIGPGYSENTASTLVRKCHVGSNGDNVHPTTASENTTPQSAVPQIYGGTLTFRPSQNSFDRSFIRRVYSERAAKQAVEKSRSRCEIETQNDSEILDAYEEKFRGPKHTTIEMRQNNRDWNTPHGTVKHNERSDVNKMPQDRMRHSHDRWMGSPDGEPTQSRIIEILRGLEVPEAYIDKARTILKNSPLSKGPQHQKPRSSSTAEAFSHSSHSPEGFQKEPVRLHERTSADQANSMQSSNGMRGWYSPSKPVKRGERQFRSPKIFGQPFKGMDHLGTHGPGIKMLNSKASTLR